MPEQINCRDCHNTQQDQSPDHRVRALVPRTAFMGYRKHAHCTHITLIHFIV